MALITSANHDILDSASLDMEIAKSRMSNFEQPLSLDLDMRMIESRRRRTFLQNQGARSPPIVPILNQNKGNFCSINYNFSLIIH